MSKPTNKLHKQEKQLFSKAMEGIEALEQDKIIPSSDNNRIFTPHFTPQPNFIEPHDYIDRLSDEYDPFENDEQRNDLNYHHESISKKQFRSLKKQIFDHQLILDLHGINRQQARRELFEFLQYCREHDYRQVAIMPGQGHGILRQALNIWLRQLPEVLAFAESPQRSGGKGVIRVLLATQQ